MVIDAWRYLHRWGSHGHVDLQTDTKNIMDGACMERGSFNENENKIDAYTWNQK